MLSSTSKQYDAKKYPLCPPWDCKRGRSYYDEFIPDLTSSLGSRSDDYDLALTLPLFTRVYAYQTFARTLYTLALSAPLFLHRPVAAPALPINATGTSIT